MLIAAGNFSSISITFKLAREMGFFMMDYYVPSILIVVISWVSFWLHVDASAPRIVLGKIYLHVFVYTHIYKTHTHTRTRARVCVYVCMYVYIK